MSIFPDRESSSDVLNSTLQFHTILASNELRRERVNERILSINMVILRVLTSFVKVRVI